MKQSLYINKSKILKIQQEDLEEIRLKLIQVTRLLNACKRIDYYLSQVNYCVTHNDKILFGESKFIQDMYIDNMLVELYKLTEKSKSKYNVFGIRDIRNFCDKLIQRYNISDDNCEILVIDDQNIVGCFQYCEIELNDAETSMQQAFKLANLQNKRLDALRLTVKNLRKDRCQVQAHSDSSRLEIKLYDRSVEDLVGLIQIKEYLRGDIAGEDAKSINEYWHTVYKVYQTIRKAIMHYICILLSIYQRQETVDSEGNKIVRALNLKDIENMFSRAHI